MYAAASAQYNIILMICGIVLFLRNYNCSLRRQISQPSPAMSVDLEAVRIRSECDGVEDLDGSGGDGQRNTRGTGSSF